jgi:Ni,Fe-hydrogenase I large subunit
MGQRVTIDPITRIEGHLRIEVEVEGGKVVNAWSSAQMFRGIEIILQGRDPTGCSAFYPTIMRCLHLYALSVISKGSGSRHRS